MQKQLIKIGYVVPEMCSQKDTQKRAHRPVANDHSAGY